MRMAEVRITTFAMSRRYWNADGFAEVLMTDWDQIWRRAFPDAKAQNEQATKARAGSLLLDNFGV